MKFNPMSTGWGPSIPCWDFSPPHPCRYISVSFAFSRSLVQLQVANTTASHPTHSLFRPLTNTAEEPGEIWGNWSAVRARWFEERFKHHRMISWPTHNLYIQSHTHMNQTHIPVSPVNMNLVWIWITRRVLPYSWTAFTLLPEFTASTLISAAHPVPRLRWSVHLNSATTGWLMGVQWRKDWLLKVENENFVRMK